MRALNFLSHVFSQLVHRWLPPLEDPGESHCPDLPIESWSLEAWRDFAMACFIKAADDSRLVSYIERQDPNGAGIARAAFEHLRLAGEGGGRVVTIGDPPYPSLLAAMRDPPLALTVVGDPTVLARRSVSIVGSRQATGRALVASYHAGKDLASGGHLVVSGGAFGCDVAAHRGVLASREQPGLGAIVFAGGLGHLYPNHNQSVFLALRRAGGLWISEKLWNASPRKWDFPVRNRIIAGLSPLTLVMQAHRRSGALITARLALEEGRDVAVLRHPEPDVRAEGGDALLAEGARGFEAEGPWPVPD